MNLYQDTLRIHQSTDIEYKTTGAKKLLNIVEKENDWDFHHAQPVILEAPGMPTSIILVHPSKLTKRSLRNPDGRAALLHAIAHIEFNAINLALDAALRFCNTPREYISDWIAVAADEARHFGLLRERLRELNYDYGDFPAHNGLWAIAEKASTDPLTRMGIVPKVLEARGLDVTPAMHRAFIDVGDHKSADILGLILREEMGHVAIGNRWFHYFCEREKLDSETTFESLLIQHCRGSVRGPFNREARLQSGFSESELEILERLSPQNKNTT